MKMLCSFQLILTVLSISYAGAAPTASTPPAESAAAHSHSAEPWDHGATPEFPIHSSCNATETRQLRKALHEAVELADHAKQHVLRWGKASEHYQKYFGDAPTGEVIGWFEKVVRGDRARVLFRCDNPDGNCNIPTYGGHWRGENATDETVICPLSYQTRKDLDEMCAFGYNVAEWNTNTYFASDLLHRLYHLPAIGEGHVEHFTETHEETLELARNNASYAVRDSDSLQYFALEVYAYDIAIPGVGCPGPQEDHHQPSSSASVSAVTETMALMTTTSAHASVSVSATTETMTSIATTVHATESSHSSTHSDTHPTPTTMDTASQTSDAPQECHTHADGVVHCD